MPFLTLFFVTAVQIQSSESLNSTYCGQYYRRPEYTDIAVDCGTTSISLAILACPVAYTGYNESLLVPNNVFSDPGCIATLDTTVTPAVMRFKFSLNQTNSCNSIFTTTSAAGTGIFSDFSNIETVNISGVIRSNDPTIGTVTYNAELKYFYSCSYPLEYLINNSRVDVSSSSIALKDNNGSFISTLSLHLYSDKNYTMPMVMPPLGLELRTNIYVLVKATNLTSLYNVLLDRCYASMSRNPANGTFFNLFVPCSKDAMTTVIENGQSQNARFSFPAFRFIQQQNETISTYYLHCITRLCEQSTCSQFQQCRRRKREAVTPAPSGVTESTTITSPPIKTKAENVMSQKEDLTGDKASSNNSIGLGFAVAVLVLVCAVMVGMAVFFCKRLRLYSSPPKVPQTKSFG